MSHIGRCPFCKCTKAFDDFVGATFRNFFVVCPGCKARGPCHMEDRAAAIAAWNAATSTNAAPDARSEKP